MADDAPDDLANVSVVFSRRDGSATQKQRTLPSASPGYFGRVDANRELGRS